MWAGVAPFCPNCDANIAAEFVAFTALDHILDYVQADPTGEFNTQLLIFGLLG